MKHQTVSLQQMKAALGEASDSKFPFKITLSDGKELVRYIRGFADQQNNVVLISETSYSLALKIIEVKDIKILEYAPADDPDNWKVIYAKWHKKPGRLLSFLPSILCLLLHISA